MALPEQGRTSPSSRPGGTWGLETWEGGGVPVQHSLDSCSLPRQALTQLLTLWFYPLTADTSDCREVPGALQHLQPLLEVCVLLCHPGQGCEGAAAAGLSPFAHSAPPLCPEQLGRQSRLQPPVRTASNKIRAMPSKAELPQHRAHPALRGSCDASNSPRNV